jgi:nicotinamidase-related amidase
MKGVALLLVDVINSFDFEGAEALIERADKVAPTIRALAARAHLEQVPVIYVNDNFGMWQSDIQSLIEQCLSEEKPGRHIVEQLRPGPTTFPSSNLGTRAFWPHHSSCC